MVPKHIQGGAACTQEAALSDGQLLRIQGFLTMLQCFPHDAPARTASN